MSSETHTLELNHQAAPRDSVQEIFAHSLNNAAAMACVDRIGLFKLRTPAQRETAAGHLPTLFFSHGEDGAAGKDLSGNCAAGKDAAGKDAAGKDTASPDDDLVFGEKAQGTHSDKTLKNNKITAAKIDRSELPAQTYELNNLQHRSAKHFTPDAVVRLPQGFDSSKPIHLAIYNHGFGSNAKSAYQQNKLGEKMADAPPNTVLIVPEWQQEPGSRSGAQGQMKEPGTFKGLLQEIFDKTPGLEGKSLKDVDSIGIFSHSAGYGPTETQIYQNGLSDKVRSVTLLDSLYDGHGFDRWLHDNIDDLSQGKKTIQQFLFGTSAASKEQAQRVKEMLDMAGLPHWSVLEDYHDGGTVMDPSRLAQHSIVFKYSTEIDGTSGGPHLSMPSLYVGLVKKADRARPTK